LTEAGWSGIFSLQPAIASWMKKETGGGSMMSAKGGSVSSGFSTCIPKVMKYQNLFSYFFLLLLISHTPNLFGCLFPACIEIRARQNRLFSKHN